MFLLFLKNILIAYTIKKYIYKQRQKRKRKKNEQKYGEGTQEIKLKRKTLAYIRNTVFVLNFVFRVLFWFFFLCLVQIKTGQEIIERFYVVL